MSLKRPLLLLLLLFCCLNGFAATFVVTSNADSGPGTLRDALTQAAANGNTEKDYITFNIPDVSETGRTINLLSPPPGISSNLEIDGNTQPGTKFGVSDAKVKIVQSFNQQVAQITSCFIIDTQTNISIYGLLLDRSDQYFPLGYSGMSGIYILNSKNIIIGAPGKGNVIKNFDSPITSIFGAAENLKISSNFISVDEDGRTVNTAGYECILGAVKNIVLGGDTPAEGNVIYGIVFITGADTAGIGYYDLGSKAQIKNNIIGENYLGQDTLLNNGKRATGSIDILGGSSQTIEVANNTFFGTLGLTSASFFSVTGNKMGTDITGTKIFLSSNLGLVLGYTYGGGIIGGKMLSDQNIFAGKQPQASTPIDQDGVIDNIGSPMVEVVGNYFKCNSGIPGLLLNTKYTATPIILNRSAVTVNGSAPPNSRVDLYYSIECSYCEPQVMFASVNADASGNWSFAGALQNHAIIAAATLSNSTSEFTRLSFTNQTSDVKITPACNAKNGSITGLQTNSATSYSWYDENGTFVANTPDLTNVGPGKYHLVITDGYCTVSSPIYEIDDASAAINDSKKQVQQPSCGNSNGSITGLQGTAGQQYTWKDANGNIAGNTLDLLNLPPGAYTLLATITGIQCITTYGPITLKNQTGPVIDQSQAKIQSTNCGQSTGSITGLVVTGTGTLRYIWWNSQQQTVGTDKDLINQPAGTYKLEVNDDTQCGAVYTTDITIPETNSITIDESNPTIKQSSCGLATGAVTGINVTGATQYQWADASNNVVSKQLSLAGVPAGTYTLTASNATGCIKTSKPYTVTALPPTVYPQYSYTSNNTCPNSATGSVTITVDTLVAAFRWVDSQGNNKGIGSIVKNLTAGTYSLYLTDKNGCESFYSNYTIANIVPVSIVAGSQQVTNDQCNLKTAGISGIEIKGGIQPYTYSWKDTSGKVVATTLDLNNVGAGIYFLTVSDASGCGSVSGAYAVNNDNTATPAPSVNNVQICSSGSVMIPVNNASATSVYNLYDSETSATPVSQSTGGKFKVNVTGNTTYYVTMINGTCESSKAPVVVSVGLSALNIANTFTPNGDGINDYWKIASIENYPQALVQIFTRDGQLVFESKGYSVPFDGTYKGKNLPSGVYYYIINLHSNCSLLSGSLTVLR